MATVKQLKKNIFPVAALFVLMAISLLANVLLVDNSALFDEYRLWLISFAVLLVVVLTFLIARNTTLLVRAYREKHPGSQLTLRLVGIVVGLMLIPAVTLYSFSTWLVAKGVDSWFDVHVESALNSSLELSRWSLDSRMRNFYEQTEEMIKELSDASDEVADIAIKNFVQQEGGPEELILLQNDRTVIASAAKETATGLMPLPPEAILREVEQSGEPYAGIDPVSEDVFYIRLVFPVSAAEVLDKSRFLYALFPIPPRVGGLAGKVEESYSKYNRLIFSRDQLKQSFLLTLSLVLLSGVLYAGWAAFYFSRNLSAPIAALDEGTRSVAKGNLDMHIEHTSKDEIGSLVDSFNVMTQRLAAAQNNNQVNRLRLERQRGYLQAVLEHVSSGVISFNQDNALRTVNSAACDILSFDLHALVGQDLNSVAKDDALGKFLFYCMAEIEKSDPWNEQLEYRSGDTQSTLLCYGQRLPDKGSVIVVSDITELTQAQRHRTWSEIARRMAHEFKNPLTPIQLSAERLNKKVQPLLDEEHGQLLKRSTEIITQQVDAMRRIVDEFSEFAQLAPIDMRDININQVAKDVAELYESNTQGIEIKRQLDPELPSVRADAGRIRQVLHNLLSNASEALKETPDPQITILTRNTGGDTVEMEVRDNGKGFAEDMIDKALEPYTTNRPDGTGLGLAIAKRIIADHQGSIRLENLDPGAAVKVSLAKSQAAYG